MAWWQFWKKSGQKVVTVADEFRRIYEDNQHKRLARNQEYIKHVNMIVSAVLRDAKADATDGYRKYALNDCEEYSHNINYHNDVIAALKRRGFHVFKRLDGSMAMEW